MAAAYKPSRVALVVHPTRTIDRPVETLGRWAGQHGLEVVEVRGRGGSDREVATPGELAEGDLVVALGGDGTVLSALRAAAPMGAPVLGVACGSVGALTAVHADDFERALDRVAGGDWMPRPLPALAIHPAEGEDEWALNDFVIARHGAGQVIVEVSVDGELYVRLAGDGLIVASPLGSSAYSMAAGGPLLSPTLHAAVCTPLAMHGGSAAPLVVPGGSDIQVRVHPGHGGFEVYVDGHVVPLEAVDYGVSVHEDKVSLVTFGDLGLGLTGLRERGLIADSPRVLARDARRSEPTG